MKTLLQTEWNQHYSQKNCNYSLRTMLVFFITLFLISQSGFAQNVGIGTTIPQGELHVSRPYNWQGVTFTGSGVDDINVNHSSYTGTTERTYVIKVSNAGPDPNKFDWSDDNGSTWTTDVDMSESPVSLSYGIEVYWDDDYGHTYNDQWSFTIGPDYPNGLIVKNAQVGIGNDSPASCAKLEISGSDKGVLVPRTDTTTVNNANTGALATGLLIYQNSDNTFYYYDGSKWAKLTSEKHLVFERNGTTIRQKGNYDTDDFIIGRDSLPQNGESVKDTMLFFDKSKAAFRVGELFNSIAWSPDNIGFGSFASGRNTKASGSYSTAMGWSTTASGSYSTAMGLGTTASGYSSTAMGGTASGSYSTAMGWGTNASGDYSTAMGWSTTASGETSTAMGWSITASGETSTAMGWSATASGETSTAMGWSTTASGDYSTAMGNGTLAYGKNSTAMGGSTTASGYTSIAMGYHTTAPSGYETVLGRYNTDYTPNSTAGWIYNDRLFVIGNGTSGSDQHNALTLKKKGFLGLNNDDPDAELQITDTNKDGSDNDVVLRLQSDGANHDAIIEFYENTSEAMSLHYDGGDNALYITDLATNPDEKRLKIVRSTGSIIPQEHKKANLGSASLAFDDIYYDDLHNEGASAFLDRSPAKEILSYPPRGKSPGEFDYKTERGDVELDPKSMPPGLADENSLFTDEIVSYNYKANYEQQLIIENQKQTIRQQDEKIKDLQKQLQTLKNQNAEILKRLEALESK